MTNTNNQLKRVTFRQLYAAECSKPTPRQAFIIECAEVTGLSISTIVQWANGIQVPNKSALKLLGEHFGCDPNYLFPKSQPSEPAQL